jgi:hypothetical protein
MVERRHGLPGHGGGSTGEESIKKSPKFLAIWFAPASY